MRFRLSAMAVVALLVCCAPVAANTIYDINFDSLFPLEQVTNQYTLQGVTFQTNVLDTLPDLIVASAQLAQSQPNLLASAFQYNDGIISFSFAPGANAVSFTALSVEDGVSVTYYNSQGGALFVDTRPAAASYSTPVYFTYSGPQSIAQVVIRAFDGSQPDTFAIDDLTYNLIPEPATAALLAVAGLAVLRRRRRA